MLARLPQKPRKPRQMRSWPRKHRARHATVPARCSTVSELGGSGPFQPRSAEPAVRPPKW
jgi:hypothetical protein